MILIRILGWIVVYILAISAHIKEILRKDGNTLSLDLISSQISVVWIKLSWLPREGGLKK